MTAQLEQRHNVIDEQICASCRPICDADRLTLFYSTVKPHHGKPAKVLHTSTQ